MRVAKRFSGWVLIILLSASGQLYGQRAHETLITTLPEDVVVGSKVLPKGDYEITNPSSVGPMLQFFSKDRRRYEVSSIAMQTTMDNRQASEDTKLILEKIGSQYYLSQIWIYGRVSGLEIPLPKRARSLKRELEFAGKQPEFRVVLATSNEGGAPKSVYR